MKNEELLLVEKALKDNLHEQTERLKITFDMMINNEKEDFYFGKDSYLNFIQKQIVKADDHINAFKNLSKICNCLHPPGWYGDVTATFFVAVKF